MTQVQRHPLKEKRKANKPLLERKRRARINDSLRDLKSLVLTSMQKDATKFSKMEKVDILDMTVQYLKGQCHDQKKADDCTAIYRAGFTECTNEVIHFVMRMPDVDHVTKTKLLSHLALSCQQQSADKSPPPSPTPSSSSSGGDSTTSPGSIELSLPSQSPLRGAAPHLSPYQQRQMDAVVSPTHRVPAAYDVRRPLLLPKPYYPAADSAPAVTPPMNYRDVTAFKLDPSFVLVPEARRQPPLAAVKPTFREMPSPPHLGVTSVKHLSPSGVKAVKHLSLDCDAIAMEKAATKCHEATPSQMWRPW